MASSVKQSYNNLPPRVRNFLIRGIILFVGWMLLYHLVLKPINFPDDQLTKFIQACTAKFLSFFYPNVHSEGAWIYAGTTNRMAIGIVRECNGLELLALYLGFIICLPTNWRRALAFSVVGVVVICFVNVLRCAGLAYMNLHHSPYFNISHHFIFKVIVYGVVFWGWMLYSKTFNAHAAKA